MLWERNSTRNLTNVNRINSSAGNFHFLRTPFSSIEYQFRLHFLLISMDESSGVFQILWGLYFALLNSALLLQFCLGHFSLFYTLDKCCYGIWPEFHLVDAFVHLCDPGNVLVTYGIDVDLKFNTIWIWLSDNSVNLHDILGKLQLETQ